MSRPPILMCKWCAAPWHLQLHMRACIQMHCHVCAAGVAAADAAAADAADGDVAAAAAHANWCARGCAAGAAVAALLVLLVLLVLLLLPLLHMLTAPAAAAAAVAAVVSAVVPCHGLPLRRVRPRSGK